MSLLSSDMYPGMELLDHMVALVLVFEEPPYCFPSRLHQFTFPHSLQYLLFADFSMIAILICVRWYFIMIFKIFLYIVSSNYQNRKALFFSCLYSCLQSYEIYWSSKILMAKNWWSSACCCCSVAQSCLTLCRPMDCSMPGFAVLHHLPELAQTHVHWVSDAIQPSRPLSSSSPPAFNLS